MAKKEPSFEAVVTELEQTRKVIQDELDGLEAKRSELKGKLSRIDGAIQALSGKSSVPAPKGAKKRAAGKPAPKKADVLRVVREVKEAGNEPIGEEELRAAVEAKLVAEGFSKNGLALRFKEVVSAGS